MDFLFVYVREAHPSDEWQMPANEKQDVVFKQPATPAERRDVARQCCTRLKLSMPCVVDDLQDTVDNLYAAWPERLFVISAEDKVVYAGGQGPFGFHPEEVEQWLAANVAGQK